MSSGCIVCALLILDCTYGQRLLSWTKRLRTSRDCQRSRQIKSISWSRSSVRPPGSEGWGSTSLGCRMKVRDLGVSAVCFMAIHGMAGLKIGVRSDRASHARCAAGTAQGPMCERELRLRSLANRHRGLADLGTGVGPCCLNRTVGSMEEPQGAAPARRRRAQPRDRGLAWHGGANVKASEIPCKSGGELRAHRWAPLRADVVHALGTAAFAAPLSFNRNKWRIVLPMRT